MSLSLALTAALLLSQLETEQPLQPPLQFQFPTDQPTQQPTGERYSSESEPATTDPPTNILRAEPEAEPTADDAFSRVRPVAGEEPIDSRYRAAPAAVGAPPGGWTGSEGGFDPTRRAVPSSSNGTTELTPINSGEIEPGKKLLIELVRIPAAEQTDGERLSLLEALQRSNDSQATVDAYWRLVLATADYQAAMVDADRVAGWRPPAGRNDREIDAAYDSSLARRAEARADWLAARHDLWRTAGTQTSSSKLPLTSDLPHAGAYVLNFDKIFVSPQAAPRAALRGRDVIPARFEGVRKRLEALQAADARLTQTENAYPRGQANGAELIRLLDQQRTARAALLRSIYIYNQEIANYAFSVPGVNNHATLASILIKSDPKPGDARSVLQSTTASEETNGAAQATFIQPQPEPALPEATPSLSPEPEVAPAQLLTPPRLVPQPSFNAPQPSATGPVPFYPPPLGSVPDQPTPATGEPTLAE